MKLFQKTREIRSREGALHFQRFAIFETSLLSLYIHRIFRADEDEHLHSHPWNFLTAVLWGAYVAENSDGSFRVGVFPSLLGMNRNEYHKIVAVSAPVTTLFLAYGKRQPWGYLVDGVHVDSDIYRLRKNEKRGYDQAHATPPSKTS